MTEMHARRLLRLADHLLTVPDESFNMSCYWTKKPDCGTAACALGWATTIPEFQEAGLILRKNCTKTGYEFGTVVFEDSLSSSNAGQNFFGMEWDDYLELFYEGNYHVRKGDVSANIRAFALKKLKEIGIEP